MAVASPESMPIDFKLRHAIFLELENNIFCSNPITR